MLSVGHVKSPLQRMLFYAYGYVGVQVNAIRFDSPSYVLNFAWNVVFNLAVFYVMTSQDPLKLEPIVSSCSHHKPLFGNFVHMGIRYSYPTMFLVKVSYFYWEGRRMVAAMGAPCFAHVYRSKRQALAIFAVVSLINNAFYVAWMFERVKVHQLTDWPSSGEYFNYGVVYIMCVYSYSSGYIIHYAQYATNKLMSEIEHTIQRTKDLSAQEERRILEAIRTLALANRELNQSMGFPYLLYTALHMLLSLVLICVAVLCTPTVGFLFQEVTIVCYFIYLIRINSNVCATFDRILIQLQERQWQQIFATDLVTHQQPYPGKMSKSLQSRQIQAIELSQYRDFFRIQIYHFFNIDLRFMMHVGLFILAYVVFFTQTD